MGDNDSWREWSNFVLMELKRTNTQIEDLDKKIEKLKDDQISKLKVEIAMLKVKAGIWGVMGGAIPVLVLLAKEMLTK